MTEPSAADLKALAEHAARRVALYRRRVYVGTGDPVHLAELQRIAEGAAGRARRARTVSTPARSTAAPKAP